MDRLGEARKDVEAAIAVCGELIPERMGDRVSYATLKGSVLKSWDGLVDYVPVISDLDIHIGPSTINRSSLETRRGSSMPLKRPSITRNASSSIDRVTSTSPDHR